MSRCCLVEFQPSSRRAEVPHGASIADAAQRAGELLSLECGGKGACGRCLVAIEQGSVPEYLVLRQQDSMPLVLACQTPVQGPLTVRVLAEQQLPKLLSNERAIGIDPLHTWAPCELELDPICGKRGLGAAIDIGTTTLRLLLLDLWTGKVVGEAAQYNPQIPLGADVITRIVAAEKGRLDELSTLVRRGIVEMVTSAGGDVEQIAGYVVAGNLTMIHLLLGKDPGAVRKLDGPKPDLSFAPVAASDFGWPSKAKVQTIPAAGAWVGGDIIAGIMRAGFARQEELSLYVDLGTNGEVVLGGQDFAVSCACSAGPAFEGSGMRCGMRADNGAVDGARIDVENQTLELSRIGKGRVRGICGSGVISLVDTLLRSQWIDRSGRFTAKVPQHYRLPDDPEHALSLSSRHDVALYERDLQSLTRAKAAIFAGIRTLTGSLDLGIDDLKRIVISGNFGRFLNLPAAMGIGLLPNLAPKRYCYVGNGSLEGASLVLLSKKFKQKLDQYLSRVTYLDLSEVPGYMDEFVGASFLPHTDLDALGEQGCPPC